MDLDRDYLGSVCQPDYIGSLSTNRRESILRESEYGVGSQIQQQGWRAGVVGQWPLEVPGHIPTSPHIPPQEAKAGC